MVLGIRGHGSQTLTLEVFHATSREERPAAFHSNCPWVGSGARLVRVMVRVRVRVLFALLGRHGCWWKCGGTTMCPLTPPAPAAKMWRSCQSDKNLKSVSRLDGSCLHGQADTHVGVRYCFEAELPVAQAASLGICFSATNFDTGSTSPLAHHQK